MLRRLHGTRTVDGFAGSKTHWAQKKKYESSTENREELQHDEGMQ